MDNDKTKLMPRRHGAQPALPALQVSWQAEDGSSLSRIAHSGLSIGRASDSDLSIAQEGVSRKHAEFFLTGSQWSVRDLESANGTFLNGRPISEGVIAGRMALQLGIDGPILWVEPVSAPQSQPLSPDISSVDGITSEPVSTRQDQPNENNCDNGLSNDEIIQRYLAEEPVGPIGDKTRMVRQAFQKVQRKQSRRYGVVIAVIASLLLMVGGLAIYQQSRLANARTLAIDMFYGMKELEVQVAQTESRVRKTGSLAQIANVQKKRERLAEMNRRYLDYLAELESIQFFKSKPSTEDEIILRVARLFGECELELPEGFVSKVKEYIAKWKSSNRFSNALARLDQSGEKAAVLEAMKKEGVPVQFLYLSMQESNFRHNAIGPETRFGIAKGAWQFIPGTATDYGLKIGPLASVRKYDSQDERFHFPSATQAAARYLKDIYAGEAQASGLLVMASYNWGHNRVRKLINKLPDNPRERNFWALINKYKIPKETYDYVFYIFSAAVIGEDPQRFGFEFDNPLI